jgi:hypothetical protein
MARHVFKKRGRGVSMSEAKARLSDAHDLVLEEETENELVVSGPAPSLRQFEQDLGGWFSAAVKSVPRPPIGAMRHARVRRL